MLCRECVLFTFCLSEEIITGPLERVRIIQSGVEVLKNKAFLSPFEVWDPWFPKSTEMSHSEWGFSPKLTAELQHYMVSVGLAPRGLARNSRNRAQGSGCYPDCSLCRNCGFEKTVHCSWATPHHKLEVSLWSPFGWAVVCIISGLLWRYFVYMVNSQNPLTCKEDYSWLCGWSFIKSVEKSLRRKTEISLGWKKILHQECSWTVFHPTDFRLGYTSARADFLKSFVYTFFIHCMHVCIYVLTHVHAQACHGTRV